jgi:hypothetical protein
VGVSRKIEVLEELEELEQPEELEEIGVQERLCSTPKRTE